ncbi:MAG: hypothetical protein LBI68_02900 [Azoarcus sp.]|jgi:hypothetical protein|nr:hypothetical protein [Azoarcus sp.]
MMRVIDMEDGSIVSDYTTAGPENHEVRQPADYPLPQLQEVSLPPKAVCPPPPLNIDALLAAFDA